MKALTLVAMSGLIISCGKNEQTSAVNQANQPVHVMKCFDGGEEANFLAYARWSGGSGTMQDPVGGVGTFKRDGYPSFDLNFFTLGAESETEIRERAGISHAVVSDGGADESRDIFALKRGGRDWVGVVDRSTKTDFTFSLSQLKPSESIQGPNDLYHDRLESLDFEVTYTFSSCNFVGTTDANGITDGEHRMADLLQVPM